MKRQTNSLTHRGSSIATNATLVAFLSISFLCGSLSAVEKHMLGADAAELVGDASKLSDSSASGGRLVCLASPGQGAKFSRLPAASKLAIHYASLKAGTISVALNDQPARKVNVHSSGALTNSFLNAIIELPIP